MNRSESEIGLENSGMTYGMRLLGKVRRDWAPYVLQYDSLHNRLLQVKREYGMKRALSVRSLTGETRTFAEILDQEVEKIVLFYLQMQGQLACRLCGLRQNEFTKLEGCPLTLEEIDSSLQRFRELAFVSASTTKQNDVTLIILNKLYSCSHCSRTGCIGVAGLPRY